MASDDENINRIYKEVVDSWNAQADPWNQWDDLGEDEKIYIAVDYGIKIVEDRLRDENF